MRFVKGVCTLNVSPFQTQNTLQSSCPCSQNINNVDPMMLRYKLNQDTLQQPIYPMIVRPKYKHRLERVKVHRVRTNASFGGHIIPIGPTPSTTSSELLFFISPPNVIYNSSSELLSCCPDPCHFVIIVNM